MMKTIAWDVDDVLNDLMREWFEQVFLVEHPRSSLRYEDIRENPPHRVLGISRETYLESLDAFRAAHQTDLAPVPEVLAWFEEQGDGFRHIAVTATPLANAHRSAAWVMQHWGRWIRVFALLPSERPGRADPRYDVSKADLIKRMGGADIVIDDSPANLEAVWSGQMKGVLYPRPWNDATCTFDAAIKGLLVR